MTVEDIETRGNTMDVEDVLLAPGAEAKDISPLKDGGVLKETVREGKGDCLPSTGCKVKVHYEGRLLDGTMFDSSRDREAFEFNLGKGSVIKAWDIGVATMKEGELARFFCREDYAYGKKGSPPKIPPEATLVFEVEMLGWEAEDLSGKKDKGILRYPLETGDGSTNPNEGSTVEIHLVGEHDGKVFEDREVSFCLGEGAEESIPPGVEKALEKFTLGEKSKLVLRPPYAFGTAGNEKLGVPGKATVTYTVTLKKFEKMKDSWMLESKEKLEHGKIFKEKGTNYFKAEKYQLALKMYKKMLDYLEFSAGFEEDLEPERKSLHLAALLNTAICYLKLQNYNNAKNQCEKALEQEADNVKALFRRGQANLSLNEPELAKADFEKVLKLDPTNKAALSQIDICVKKIKETHKKEKEIYSNMFGMYTQKKELRFGWWEENKVKAEIAPDDPELEEEKKREKQAKLRFIEEQRKLLEEMKERRKREAAERAQKEEEEKKALEKEEEGKKEQKEEDEEKKASEKEEEEKKASEKEEEEGGKAEKPAGEAAAMELPPQGKGEEDA